MPEASQMGGTRARVGRFLNSVNGNTNRRWLKGVAPTEGRGAEAYSSE